MPRQVVYASEEDVFGEVNQGISQRHAYILRQERIVYEKAFRHYYSWDYSEYHVSLWTGTGSDI